MLPAILRLRYRTGLAVIAILIAVSAGVNGESLEVCWSKWVEQKLAKVPKPGDVNHPVTGRPLSQTPGAIRTRALKYQAAQDALDLRGKQSPEWQIFHEACARD
jgi:hypothetical protein